MSLINISKQWDKWDKRLKNLFFQIEIVPSDLGSGGERVRPWQKIICLVPTWGKKEGSCGLFSLFHNLEREQPIGGDQSECGKQSLGRSSWDWCCSQLGESEAPISFSSRDIGQMIKGRPLWQNKKQDIVNCDEVKIELEEERCTQWRNFTWSVAQVQSIGEHQKN